MEDTIADQVEKANAVVRYFEQKLPGIADFGIKILIALLVFLLEAR